MQWSPGGNLLFSRQMAYELNLEKKIDEENLKAWVNHEVCCDLLILGAKNQH